MFECFLAPPFFELSIKKIHKFLLKTGNNHYIPRDPTRSAVRKDNLCTVLRVRKKRWIALDFESALKNSSKHLKGYSRVYSPSDVCVTGLWVRITNSNYPQTLWSSSWEMHYFNSSKEGLICRMCAYLVCVSFTHVRFWKPREGELHSNFRPWERRKDIWSDLMESSLTRLHHTVHRQSALMPI